MDAQRTARTVDAETILVCDDDPSLRELVRAVLGPRYLFVEADDGTEALILTRELRPDLIVLDVMLPGLSGIEVLEALRLDDELRSIPVVVITAWSHAEIDAQVAGADRFVSKPFDPDDLSTAVEELPRHDARTPDVACASAVLAVLVGALHRPHRRRLRPARGDRARSALEGRHGGVAAAREARLGRRDRASSASPSRA